MKKAFYVVRKNAWLIEDLNHQLDLNKNLLLQSVSALAMAIEAKDKYTMGHIERVVEHAITIAHNLKNRRKIPKAVGAWDRFVEDLRIAALLHDIGKIGVPENILGKKGRLNSQERNVIRNHPVIGTNILLHIEKFDRILQGVKHHHERYDGTGYPLNLKGRKIPLIASIICLADAFDAMTTDRPYRRALGLKQALKEVKVNRGKQFAPEVVDAFLETYQKLT